LCQRRTLSTSRLHKFRLAIAIVCGSLSGTLITFLDQTAAGPICFWTWTITQGHAGGPPQRVLRSALA
jgi:hypothetical protein